MRAEQRTLGWWVVAEQADLCYLSGPREVGPVSREAALAVAHDAQQQVDAERIARLAPFLPSSIVGTQPAT